MRANYKEHHNAFELRKNVIDILDDLRTNIRKEDDINVEDNLRVCKINL